MANMKIGIAGYGFVGKAQELLISNHGQYDILLSDPRLGLNDDLTEADAVIIAVATPPAEDWSCDVSNVIDVISSLPTNIHILIKSTMSVEGWDMIRTMFPDHSICFSPEFLREASWQDDAFSPNIYLGGDTDFWDGFFTEVFQYEPDSVMLNITVADPRELIVGKAFRNSFLATKVAFFNQIYDYCQAYDLDYNQVRNTICDDIRIGYSHTDITEQRGFGGHCFPKDSNATVMSGRKKDVHLSILQEAIDYNNDVRSE